LVSDRKFKSARALLDRERATVPDKERADLAAETDQACRAYLAEQMIRFRRNLTQVPTLSDLRAMTKNEFEITFSLPPSVEIVVEYPPYDWARAHLPALQEAWANKARAGSGHGGGPRRADEGTENPWFRMADRWPIGMRGRRRGARPGVDRRPEGRARTALANGRSVLQSWKDHHARFNAAFRARYPILDDHDRRSTPWKGAGSAGSRGIIRACFDGPTSSRSPGAGAVRCAGVVDPARLSRASGSTPARGPFGADVRRASRRTTSRASRDDLRNSQCGGGGSRCTARGAEGSTATVPGDLEGRIFHLAPDHVGLSRLDRRPRNRHLAFASRGWRRVTS
jgi:hypothetical protein